MKNAIFIGGFLLVFTSCTISRDYQITGQPIGTKSGVAKSKIIGNSDTSIKKAAENGNITKIGAVEFQRKLIRTKTVVHGE
jgi:hypothetical protein